MINNVTLVGRLTKDPELRYTANGTGVATFTLAINRNFTNQAGEREADFVQCVIWRKPAETLANYARKGTLLGVTGRIQTRSYDNQQGQRVYVTEVVAENFQLLESKATSEQRQSTQASQPTQQANRQNYNEPVPSGFPSDGDMPTGAPVGATLDISDDNLPF
ncbi:MULTISPECIES: single-stranded DNA-binding protein [unclassified Enterococcus]|uniref:single-stranded DNA-binding protein n=1 Tax=unclassified Enterococcus TaxID=2608891 RepID=UPI0019067986|nr:MULTISPECIES: single-stranded DNA-binding protein [unclassified Enterococcus]MBK0039347.1 single-stranded DNA-binding protein [Enterococcus sp. S52]MBK0072004.1 single-stranded DNA-binding protein [Enterococcus sp. S53]MBK0142601.1 single-stranded DNA-binding protein [Enterococcus sp. S76]MBK0146127.1 single-stranded DNA-binding protein [Enterococcus sp. S77]